jgi:inhibitor of KinA
VAHPLVRAAAARLEVARLPFVQDLVPAYTTLSIFFDPLDHDYSAVSSRVLDLIQGLEPAARASGREVVIPVVYHGPDLTDVARQTGLREAEVVSRHSARIYEVYLVGFAPGWAYLGDLDPSLVLPRRAAPRQRVPAGSVAIAGGQTGVYPFAIPGGWHLIGRTDTVMFDAARQEPALLRVGDRVRFESRT